MDMKKYEVVIHITADDDFDPNDLVVDSSECVDGFDLYRSGEDNICIFYLKDADIISIKLI